MVQGLWLITSLAFYSCAAKAAAKSAEQEVVQAEEHTEQRSQLPQLLVVSAQSI